MKPINQITREYLNKLPNIPVKITPFAPQKKLIAREYIKNINKSLNDWHINAHIIGSTAYGIAGKEGIEIGIFLNNSNWSEVISKLENMGKHTDIIERDFAQFDDMFEGYEIDIILLKGHAAKVNKAIHDFFIKHPDMIKKYEEMKKKFSYSKREYQKQKSEFINEILEEIPEEDYYIEKYEKDFDL